MLETLVTVIILCNNQNWEHSARCTAPVASFWYQEGRITGELTSGVQFTQTPVLEDSGVKLQRFQLEEAYWYVSDKGIIQAESDIQALSVYLSKV